MHREMTIAGDPHVHLSYWQPSATVERVRIVNAPWAGREPPGTFDSIAVRIGLIPLLRSDANCGAVLASADRQVAPMKGEGR